MMKKYLALILALVLAISTLAGCGATNVPADPTNAPMTEAPAEAPAVEEPAAVESIPKLMVMSGPTGVGAAQLIADHESTDEPVIASAEVVADNEAVKNALVSGEVDIAAIATNMASTLYNKTDGAITVLGVNTLGVLYILEKGDSVQQMADLKGKTLYATGQGANPEYILNYLLTSNGVDPSEVDIQWMTAQEITAKMTTEEAAICMLPVPAATTVMMKDQGVREAVSLSDEWEKLGNGSLAQGCIVVRTEFLEENPNIVASFMKRYQKSIDYMNDEANREEAAELVAKYGITANAQVAAQAIPSCNLVCIEGQQMKDILTAFFEVMYQANPASIGGEMPEDDFYYGAQ